MTDEDVNLTPKPQGRPKGSLGKNPRTTTVSLANRHLTEEQLDARRKKDREKKAQQKLDNLGKPAQPKNGKIQLRRLRPNLRKAISYEFARQSLDTILAKMHNDGASLIAILRAHPELPCAQWWSKFFKTHPVEKAEYEAAKVARADHAADRMELNAIDMQTPPPELEPAYVSAFVAGKREHNRVLEMFAKTYDRAQYGDKVSIEAEQTFTIHSVLADAQQRVVLDMTARDITPKELPHADNIYDDAPSDIPLRDAINPKRSNSHD